jgi:hypothetical protein
MGMDLSFPNPQITMQYAVVLQSDCGMVAVVFTPDSQVRFATSGYGTRHNTIMSPEHRLIDRRQDQLTLKTLRLYHGFGRFKSREVSKN